MLYIFDTIIDETAVARVKVADNGARERFTLLLCADEQPVNHTNQAYLGPIPCHRAHGIGSQCSASRIAA
jgi:hypothetical protein